MSNSDIDKAGYGPLEGQEFVAVINGTLGTTAQEVTALGSATTGFVGALAAYPNAFWWRLKIYNPSAGSTLAWQTSNIAAVSSTATADFASTAASHIAPGQTEWIVIPGSRNGALTRKLWIVSSGAGASVSVTISPVT